MLKRLCIAALLLAATTLVASRAGERVAHAASGSRFVPLAPVRLFDTRADGRTLDGRGVGSGKVGRASTVEVEVVGRAGIPVDVTAVALNVTAIDATWGYVQVLPTGSGAIGQSSNLNIEMPGQIVANLAVVPVGAGGRVTIYAQGPSHFAVDALGYFVPDDGTGAGRYRAATGVPARRMDTRTPQLRGRIDNPGDVVNCTDFAQWKDANAWYWKYLAAGFGDVAKLDSNGDGVPCEGLPGKPANPTPPLGVDLFQMARGEARSIGGWLPGQAVVLNVTVDKAQADGYVQAYPTGGSTSAGSSSNVNVKAGETRANLVIVPAGVDGSVTLFHQAGGHLVVDLVGSFTPPHAPAAAGGLFVPVTPDRLLDTRSAAKPGTASRTLVQPLGRAGLPPSGVSAVMVNLTATEPAEPGYVVLFPSGSAVPLTSSLNVQRAGQTVANAAIGNLGVGGALELYSMRPVHLVLDTSGYFTDGT